MRRHRPTGRKRPGRQSSLRVRQAVGQLLGRLEAERGNVIVILAIALTALMGVVALGTDVGRLYLAKQKVAVIADAAALSGAQLLPYGTQQAVNTVQEYLRKNGVSAGDVTVSLSQTDHTVSVSIIGAVDFTFARIMGFTTGHVAATAVARTAPLTGYNAVVPLGVVQADWKLGDPVILKSAPNNGQLSPGNYGPLALGGTGASTYENNLQNGYTGWIRAGDWLRTETGNMEGPTQRAILARINLDPYATYQTVKKGSPRIAVVPILQSFETNGRGEVNCVGFGAFFLESVGDQGNDRGTVYGRFIRYVLTGESTGSGSDFATYTIKLTQ